MSVLLISSIHDILVDNYSISMNCILPPSLFTASTIGPFEVSVAIYKAKYSIPAYFPLL